MDSLQQLSGRLIENVRTFVPNEHWPNITIEQNIENQLMWCLDDVLKAVANINETSLNKMDRAQRLIDLEAQYGIPKTHTIILKVGYKL